MAAKTSWHRYGTKLYHCHPMYRVVRIGVRELLFICGPNKYHIFVVVSL